MKEPHYLCYWGEGYGIPTHEIHALQWFTPDSGYGHAEVWQLSGLEIGQSLDLTDQSGFHVAVRVL